MGLFYPDIDRWDRREFYEKGKPTPRSSAPMFSYEITRIYNDLWAIANKLERPFDHTFLLTDEDVSIEVRVVRSDVASAESWSINGKAFIFNDCTGRKLEILKVLDSALLREQRTQAQL